MKPTLLLIGFLAIMLISVSDLAQAQTIEMAGLSGEFEIENTKQATNPALEKDKTKDFECGDLFIDPRDGQEYTTVQIGDQCWMGQNLNFGNRIDIGTDMTNNGIAEKHCYDDDPSNCETYGALYQWNELMQYTVTEGIQGLCPDGWHIPSDSEWCTLEQTVDNSISCSAIMWRGTDGGTKLKAGGESGFEGLLGGYIFSEMSSMQIGDFGYFWNSTFYNDSWAFFRALGDDFSGVRRHYTSKEHGKSVRCLKGEGAENLPPTQPANPIPEDGADEQSIGITLQWTCTDPENDPLTYDVYLGTNANPPLLESGVLGITYTPDPLAHLTKYFWKVVAHDTQGNTSESPVWNFTTKKQGGITPCGGLITDPRDGQTYNTVLIGDQCWMAENLNIGERIDATTQMGNNSIIEKYCYDNDPAKCNDYGGLYQWDEMMQYATSQGAQGICMTGWRLPTDNEWKALEGTVDSEFPVDDPEWDNWSWRGSDVGGNLKEISTTHWDAPNAGASNSSGFTAVGGGYTSGSSFSSLRKFGMYWTSTPQSQSNAIMRGIYYALPTVMRNDYSKSMAISGRCIQGVQAPNEPPATPSNPNPANGSTGQTLNSSLQWTCSDPDGDPLTYDVYFGTDENPALLAEGISENTFDPGVLEYYTNYYWKIIAFDDHGNSKEGSVWSFTTTQLFFSVTFDIVDENLIPLSDAVITLNGVTNNPGDYLFDEVPEGTFNYAVELDEYITTYGQVTVVDQNIELTVTLPTLFVVGEFPFNEDFSGGELPLGWRNTIQAGDFGWEFALTPFPHTFIHNIGRPAIDASLITPLLDASGLGQVKLGINQRFLMESSGGTISIVLSEDGLNWETVAEYDASIGTGDDFEYIEYNLNDLASGKQVFIALVADFPDTDANYEAVWEVESLIVFKPDYMVDFIVVDTAGTAINNASITLDEITNPEGNYQFDNLIAGTYQYIAKAENYLDNYGFVTLLEGNITDTIVMKEAITIDEFPYTQDFEANILPEGWNNIILGDPDGYWRFQEQQGQIMSNYGERTHSMLVSPAFDCSLLESVTLGLNHYYYDIYGVGFAEILVSTDGENWTTIAHFQGEAVGSSDFPYFEYFLSELAAGQEQVYIGLLYDDLAETEFWWLVDAFTIYEPMPYNLSLKNLSGNKYVNDGEAGTFEFELVNTGSENDTYSFEVQNASWEYEVSQQTIMLNAGQKDTITVTVTVPLNLNMGEKNTMSLSASSQGDPSVLDEAPFTTVAVSTIKDNYFEDFDLAVAPELPGGWSKIQQSTASWSRVETVENASIDPVSAPNNVQIYAASDLDPTLILISPEIDESISLSEFRVVFWLRNPPSALLKIGTMSSPTGQFTELASYSSPNHFTWELKMFSYEDYQGSDKYMAFKLENSATGTGVNLDDISIEIIPPPILKANPDSWDFGEYWVEYPSEVPLDIDVKNIGHDYLTISNIYLDHPDDFLMDYDHTLLNSQMYWNENIPLTVHFNASEPGVINGNIVIEYNDGIDKTKLIPLDGVGLERPIGSTCDNPITLELPVVDYENTTEFAGNDYNNFMVYPWAGLLRGYDMDFIFTIEEESYLNATISGPYYGPSLYITDRCPDVNNPAPLYAWIENAYGGSFEDVILPAGEYKLIVSSPAAANPYTYYSPFVLNLTAVPTPDLHSVTFNLFEDNPEQTPVDDAEISINGFQTDLTLNTNMFGQIQQNLYEYEYHVYIYKQDYGIHDFMFTPTSDTVLNIPMNDLIWTPHSLSVETEGLLPGQALFDWIARPQGEPWEESFEAEYPPAGWDTIVTNHGQVEEPGYDWKFTWQKYGTVYFSNLTVEPIEGDFQAFIHWSTDPQDEWLISKEFEAPAGNLEFWYSGLNGSSFCDYYVKVSTDGGETWFELWNASDLPNGRNNYDFPVILDLQPWAEQNIRIAWQALGSYGMEGAWCIDKISAGEMKISVEDLMYVSKSEKPAANTFSGTIPSTRDGADLPRVTFEDMNYNFTNTRANKGFSIYLDDMENPVATGVEESEFMFIGLEVGNYVAGVQAVTTTGESEIVSIPFNNPIAGIEYQIHFYVENQSGQALSGALVKVFYAGELLTSSNTFNGNTYATLYPGDYDFTIFKDGYKTYEGEFSVSNGAIDVNAIMETGYQLEFIVQNQDGQPLQDAVVYCDGIVKNTSSAGTTTFEIASGTYPYSVTHPLYDRVLSSVVVQASASENVVMPYLTCERPEALSATIENTNAVLNWEIPDIGSSGIWIHWDREFGNNAIGTGGSLDFDVAQRFDTDDLRPHNGKFLTRVWFFPYYASCDYYIRVWTGGDISGPESLVVEQYVDNPVIGEWNEIFLITPVPIDANQELWIGQRNITPDGYPASVDVGPATDGKGNMIRLPGNDWQTLLELNAALDFNWSVRGLVERMDSRFPQLAALPDENKGTFTGELSITNNPIDRSLYSPRILSGYNIYRDDVRINNSLVQLNNYVDINMPFGEVNYNITSVWSNGCESEYSNTATVFGNICQDYYFNQGWNSMSGFVVPENPALEDMFAPVQNELIFIQNLNGFYWPAQTINTIGDFDNSSGYALKVSEDLAFTYCGESLAQREIALAEGWHYLPVLSECEVNLMELLASVTDDVAIVQDLIGTAVYWPEMGINTLETLIPGRAYKIKLLNPTSLVFPDCVKSGAAVKHSQVNTINSEFGKIQMTPFSRIIYFSEQVFDDIFGYDMIGAYDNNGQLCGILDLHSKDGNQVMTLFGDDPLSGEKEGFAEDEKVNFKAMTSDNSKIADIEVLCEMESTNPSGNFRDMTLAKAIKISLEANSTSYEGQSKFTIYPNPAKDKVNILASDSNQEYEVEIYSAKGEVMLREKFSSDSNLDVSTLKQGVYLVRISSTGALFTQKLIIQ